MFADMDLRLRLLTARTEDDFKKLLYEHMKELAQEQSQVDRKESGDSGKYDFEDVYSVSITVLYFKIRIHPMS